MKSKLLLQLKGIVGDANVLTDDASILEASKDYIGFRRYERCDGKSYVNQASCVVKAGSALEIAQVLKLLNENKIDVVPRTGGSSVTMGIEPQPDGVILDGSLMNEILDINIEDMMVTARCGTPIEYIESVLNEKGYTTGHFPQSFPMAHAGGLAATRSIGQFSTLYGGIEDLVVGMEAVLPDGTIVRIKNVPRRSVGPDLRHVLIGGEGAFGFITEVTLKIFRYQPENRWMNAYAVRGMEEGLHLIRQVMVDGYRPAVVRLHDPSEVERLFNSVCPEGYSLLLILAEGPKPITDAIGAEIMELTAGYDSIDLGTKPVEHWLIHRNDVCQTLDGTERYEKHMVADTCEISAGWSQIWKIYEAVVERMSREIENLLFVGGHSSHSYVQGTNIYFTFGFKCTGSSETVHEDYMKVVTVIMEETLKRGGSIAHHHGSGKYRTKWMPEEHGSSYELLRRLKTAVDPNNIMNQGVLFERKETDGKNAIQ